MKNENSNQQKMNIPENSRQQNTGNNALASSNTVKNPDEWTTGNEPMTGAQQSYLKTLSDEAGEDLNTDFTKAEASKKIEELQQQTGRGLDQNEQ